MSYNDSLSTFPFDAVAITFPDASAARAASRGPLEQLRQAYPSTTIVATNDPYATRVGSGGGTLHALEQVLQRLSSLSDGKEANDPPSVLILHAGGASSRCPSQMVLGKAWTSLPTITGQRRVVQTPLLLWFQLCHETLFVDLPRGSLVVIASDTLLDIPRTNVTHWNTMMHGNHPNGQQLDNDAVVALSVPAALNVAKNHGVFVMPQQQSNTNRNDDDDDNDSVQLLLGGSSQISPCAKVYQKPSLETLQHHCAFSRRRRRRRQQQPQQQAETSLSAWIDTGVIVFLPRAANSLRSLLDTTTSTCQLLCCTQEGIQLKYQQSSHQQSLPEFASQNANSIDLYTHVLNALQLQEAACDNTTATKRYCQQYQTDLPQNVLELLHQTLSPLPLLVWTVPTGTFLHLGTTGELMQFLSITTTTNDSPDDAAQSLRRHLASNLGLTSWLQTQTLMESSSSSKTDAMSSWPGVVAVESHLAASEINIGTGSVLEHCFLHLLSNDNSQHRIDIGEHCLVSGIRTSGGGKFCLRSGLMVQQVTLNMGGNMVYMVLGVLDNIKTTPCEQMYGVSFSMLLRDTGLSEEEIWPDSTKKKSLWNAKIHPILPMSPPSSFNSLFDWINELGQGPNPDATLDTNAKTSLQLWQQQPRLSLADIRSASHAPSEFTYRARLSSLVRSASTTLQAKDTNDDDIKQTAQAFWNQHQRLYNLRRVLISRQHTAVPTLRELGNNDASISYAFRTLDEVIVDAFEQRNYDICGRAWMLMSAMLAECVTNATHVLATEQHDTASHQILSSSFSDTNDMVSIVDHFATVRDNYFQQGGSRAEGNISLLTELIDNSERLAQIMTRWCVMGGQEEKSLATRPTTQDCVLDCWVLSTAPARIDLAGGWSDTPPICFEYGSSVAGLAVAVDGTKPLSARSRLSPNGNVVVLKSEHRDFQGQLLSVDEVELDQLNQLKGYNNPSEKCALLKCALVILGVVSADQILSPKETKSIGSILAEFCGLPRSSTLGLQVIVTSLLPHGSGMGSSSIIAGCVLSSMAKCMGIRFDSSPTANKNGLSLVQSVLALEQMLSTGGGHQDQVNGLFPGAKLVHCQPLEFPLCLSIDSIQLDEKFEEELNDNLILVFTGRTRLAKNILQSCLRRWAMRTPAIVENLKGLIDNALAAAKTLSSAFSSSSMDQLGRVIDTYWQQKVVMAGEDSGVEPDLCSRLIRELKERKAIHGASLCGAGGGGFMVLLKCAHVTMTQIESSINDAIGSEDARGCKVYSCSIGNEGLHVSTLPVEVVGDDSFDVAWLRIK